MASLQHLDRKAAEAIWDLASGSIIGGPTLQQAADALIEYIHRELNHSLALARGVCDGPLRIAPGFSQEFRIQPGRIGGTWSVNCSRRLRR